MRWDSDIRYATLTIASGNTNSPWYTIRDGRQLIGIYPPPSGAGANRLRLEATHDLASANPVAHTVRNAEETDPTPEPWGILLTTGLGRWYNPIKLDVTRGIERFRLQAGTDTPTADLVFTCVFSMRGGGT